MRTRLIWFVMAVATMAPAWGATVFIDLGSASSFGLLGGTISNTGTSAVTGDVGATTTITGFGAGTGTATGTVFPAPSDPTVAAAYTDFTTAFDAAMLLTATQPPLLDLTGPQTFDGNNVYTFSSPDISTATGINLTFDAHNDPNAFFVIRTDGALTVNGILTFSLQGQAQADHIFWIVGTVATISVGSSPAIDFDGNILAGTSFTMSAKSGDLFGGTIHGCVFAETANTLAGPTNVSGCSGLASGSEDAVPEPGSLGLVGAGCLAGILAWRRWRVNS